VAHLDYSYSNARSENESIVKKTKYA